MQIVIDIPKSRYNEIVSGIFDADGYFKTNLTLAFRNSTVLPKGHGRLIDADDLDITTVTTDDYSGNEVIDIVLKEDIDDAPTIVEADTLKRRKGTPLEENGNDYNCENWIP